MIYVEFGPASSNPVNIQIVWRLHSPPDKRMWCGYLVSVRPVGSAHISTSSTFSVAERPSDRRAYTHKLTLELDTSVSIFNWLREGRRLRGVELEGSLDYVATGLPKRGDRIDTRRYLDDAMPGHSR